MRGVEMFLGKVEKSFERGVRRLVVVYHFEEE
jgi:hypothetical protein